MGTKIRIFGLAAAVSLLGTGIVSAADIYTPRPAPEAYEPAAAPPPIFSWEGLYAGVHGGYGWGDADTPTGPDIEIDGAFGGAQLGYNWLLSEFLVGVEGDISWSGIDGTTTAPSSHEIDWFGTIRGRVGMPMGRTLPYITGGVAFAEGSQTVGGATASATHTGYVAGAGIEQALTEQMSAKLEYQFLDFGDETYVGPGTTDVTAHTIRAGVNFRFWTQ